MIPVDRSYELMWILGADCDEQKGAAAMERVATLVAENGGEMVRSDPWGRRTLSYPIDGNREGSYFLAYFRLDSARAPAVERALEADQEVIRHLLMRRERPIPAAGETENPDEEPSRPRRRRTR